MSLIFFYNSVAIEYFKIEIKNIRKPEHKMNCGVFNLLTRCVLQRVEEMQQERRDLLKAMRLLQEEKQRLQEEQKRLVREREQERETCCLLRTHNQVAEEAVWERKH